MKKNLNENQWVKWFWKWYFISLLFIALFFTALSLGWLGFMPSFEELENPKSKLASDTLCETLSSYMCISTNFLLRLDLVFCLIKFLYWRLMLLKRKKVSKN